MRNWPRSLIVWSVAVALGLPCFVWPGAVQAESIFLTPTQDNTLYRYDPADPNSQLNSNGRGDFVSAGRTFSRSEIRRGLLLFDFSTIPPEATVVADSVRLGLYVVDIPKRDSNRRPFWLVPIPQTLGPWGEGPSAAHAGVSGAGSGAPAQEGDATWFHTRYDPAAHDPTVFVSGGLGYWPFQGVLGDDPLDAWARFGDPVAMVDSDIGPVTFSSGSLESDINDWIAQRSVNAGWILIGDESIASDQESSNRGFASRQHADAALRPQLTLEYVLVPEPPSALLLAAGILGFPRGKRKPYRAHDAKDGGLFFPQ